MHFFILCFFNSIAVYIYCVQWYINQKLWQVIKILPLSIIINHFVHDLQSWHRHMCTHREVHSVTKSHSAPLSPVQDGKDGAATICAYSGAQIWGGAEEGPGNHCVQVGGAEVIHFKGKINDTINTRLGHCRGGRGTIYTQCWQPGPWAHTVMLRRRSSAEHTSVGHWICQGPTGHIWLCNLS